MSFEQQDKNAILKIAPVAYLLLLLSGIFLVAMFYDGLAFMVKLWSSREEYSHGFMIPFIAAFLVWQKKNILQQSVFTGSWAGLFIIIAGLVLYMAGELATLYIIIQYAFLMVLAGLVLTFTGWTSFKRLWVAFLILIFMIPLPTFFLNNLSLKLQLISSELGVAIIRLFDISVFLEGNVIDLGAMKLQVVDACSGLNYLFPLMTLGFIAAYFYKGPFWHRLTLFLSTIPITVLMNSFRIGMVGVMVEYWGKSMAEGFLHYFEGWVLFVLCMGTLILEMWLFTRFSKQRLPLREVFGIDFPAPTPKNTSFEYRKLTIPFKVSFALLFAVSVLSLTLPERNELNPDRQHFSQFDPELGEWRGKKGRIEKKYIETLLFDDYIISDFINAEGGVVNLYIAYYASQKKGQSAHSPRTCIPGGGWEIKSITEHGIDGLTVAGGPLKVNRTLIQKDEDKQLVYYWFQQRSRVITNEYLVKWFIFWDALTKNRTDGALIRLTTYIGPGQSVEQADKQLASFANAVTPYLDDYIPK